MSKFISLITPTFDSSKFINTNLQSVIEQNYSNLEHIFIDNKSNDQTLTILEEYKQKVNYEVKIISERDQGIYDAFNKGLEISRGEIITILNSDDFFLKKNTLNKVQEIFSNPQIDVLYGNIKIVKRNNINKLVRSWKTKLTNNKYYMIPHPSFFISNKINAKKFRFDLSYEISADLDYIIKIFKGGVNSTHINDYIVAQRAGGTSQRFINIIKANIEVFKILKKNNIKNKYLFLLKKLFFKMRQFKNV